MGGGGVKFVPEMHLKEASFTYSAWFVVHLPKTKKELQSLCGQDFIYKYELDKACFQHDMAHGKSKHLGKRTQSDKVLRDKAFKIASDPKFDG